MNVALLRPDRSRLERFGRLVREGKRREAIALQAQRGWYDENGVRQGGLIAFVRYYWHILEPKTPLVEGWPLWAMCLPYDTKITTEEGEKYIGDLVESGWRGNVLSFNHKTSKLEWKPVVARMKSPAQPLLRLETSRGGVLQLTHNHPVYVLGRGYVRADEIGVGNRIYLHSLSGDISGSTERKPILQSAMLLGRSHQGRVGGTYARLQALWKTVLSAALPPNWRILFNAMLGRLKNRCREYDMSTMWWKENVEPYPAMSGVLDRIAEKRTAVELRLVRQSVSAKTLVGKAAATAQIRKRIWKVLQFEMFGQSKSREEQSFLCQREPRQSLSSGVLDGSAKNLSARAKALLSLFGREQEVGCAPHRSRYDEQRGIESRRALSPLPLSAARSCNEDARSNGCGSVGSAVVTAIMRETRIPDAVYNVEVLGNNNYFAEGILVHNCEHLEAITFGDITRLLINVPPGFMKSLLTNVFWPAWEWGPMDLPHLRYVTFSYAAHLTERDNGRFRDLIMSREYRVLWGERFRLTEIGKIKVANNATGWKLATSIGGVGTGERGDRVLLDDPHNVKEAESDQVRGETVRWFQEAAENRLNDIVRSAIVIDMQRVHGSDVSGAILDAQKDTAPEFRFCHLMIAMEYDAQRYPVGYNGNDIGWLDPREDDGDLAWEARFPADALAKFKKRVYMWSGQYQQLPTPRGGGIIREDTWMPWPSAEYPPCELILGSLDTAYTEKEENDASALTIWGVFRDNRGFPKAMLLYAWEGRLELHDLVTLTSTLCSIDPRSDTEMMHATALYNRGDVQVEMIARMPVDKLLIEAKASGISVAQEMHRLYGGTGNFAVELIDPRQWGDKSARLTAVEPMFADEMIYAPLDREWAERVIDNVTLAPKTTKWDTPDSVSMALRYLRQTGSLLKRDEQAREAHEEGLHRPQARPLY